MNAESELGRYLPPSPPPFYTKRGFSTETKERDMMDLSEQCKPKKSVKTEPKSILYPVYM